MEPSSIIDKLQMVKDQTPIDILISLIDGRKDIELKTEIENTINLTLLVLYGGRLNQLGLKGSSKIISEFRDTYLRFQISKKRKSREEIIKAIIGLLADRIDPLKKPENTALDKMLKVQGK